MALFARDPGVMYRGSSSSVGGVHLYKPIPAGVRRRAGFNSKVALVYERYGNVRDLQRILHRPPRAESLTDSLGSFCLKGNNAK